MSNTIREYIRALLKRTLGPSFNPWMNWVRVRIEALRERRSIYRGHMVEWHAIEHAWCVPFEITGPADQEVLIKATCSAISPGTEAALFSRKPNTPSSLVKRPGYSMCGEIVAVGKGVKNLTVGQRVIAGAHHASLVKYPAADVYAVPDGVRPEEAAFFQMGIIALQGVWRAGLQGGERVVVLGRGTIGQLALLLARALGAGTVLSVAPSASKITKALEHSADQIIVTRDESPEILDMLEADVTLEVSGNPMAISDAVRATRHGGRIVMLGSPRGVTTDFDFRRLTEKNLTVLGSHVYTLPQERNTTGYDYQSACETFLRLLAERKIDVLSMIDVDVNPWEAGWFYENLAWGSLSCVGALFRWDRLKEHERAERIQAWQGPELEAVTQVQMRPAPLYSSL